MFKIKNKVYARFHDDVFELATIRDIYTNEDGEKFYLCKAKKKSKHGITLELWLSIEDLQPLIHINLPEKRDDEEKYKGDE